MDDRTSQVVNHEMDNGLNLLFVVAGIMGQCGILISSLAIELTHGDL